MRGFLLSTILFALLHYFLLLLLDGFIFVLVHIPPGAMSLDPLIFFLVGLQKVFIAPRLSLRLLWPSETTPHFLNTLLVVINSLVWGALLAALRNLKRRVSG